MPTRVPYGDYRDFSPGGLYYNPEEFRADEIQRGRDTGTYATHGGSLTEIQQALDQLSRDKGVMQQLQQGHTQYVESKLAEMGLALPRHYALDVDGGRIVPREQGKWERWKTPILLTAAMFGGGFALEAALGAGAGGAGVLPSTVIGNGYVPAIAGGSTVLEGLGAATGVGALAGAPLAATVFDQAMSGLPAGGSHVLERGGGGIADSLKKVLGMGNNADESDLLPLILRSLTGLGSAALQPKFFQEKKSFSGTGADPVDWMSDARSAIGGAYNSAAGMANEPTDFTGAGVGKPKGYSGGGLPMPIGLTTSPDAVNQSLAPKRVPLQFKPMPHTTTSRNRQPGGTGDVAVPRPNVPKPTVPGRTNPNPAPPGAPPPDRAVPRDPQNLENMFADPTGAQPQQDDSPGRASARLLLASLMGGGQGGR